jgi:hypothetical protein
MSGWSTTALGQNPNQFGGQDRADAASRMIVLGVQQGISSLPPTAGQSFVYEFDPSISTYVSSERLGPTALRSPQTIGAHKLSLRAAFSYFELADTVAPIPFLLSSPPGSPLGVAKIGLQANAHVTLVNLGANYGITDRIDVTLNVPVVAVDAHASQIFSTDVTTLNVPASQAPLSGVAVSGGSVDQAVEILNQELQPGGQFALRKESFQSIGFNFNESTHSGVGRFGVGRISLGAKGILYAGEQVQVALAPEFFFPSPGQAEFAGPNSGSILPRVIAAYRIADPVRLHLDLGYDCDFDSDELRRFVWNTGASFAISSVTFDLGIGGSQFNQGIQWTPSLAAYHDQAGNPGTIQALGETRLGSSFIDALGGVKLRVGDKTVLSGSVNVPLNNEGFRAAAVGTLALEQYF